MDAFLENSMFFFLDEAEPIVPIFRSPRYNDAGRIVEVTDVGCDTETTFPIHFSRTFDRRRGGAESLRSARRIAKWREKSNNFARRTANDRNGNYTRRKTRQDYDDTYIADLDYDDSYSYDDIELSKNDSAVEEEDNYYAQFINPQNAIARSRKERVSRYDYLRDLEDPFTRNIRVPESEDVSSRWFSDRDDRGFHKIHNTDIRSGERKKRTKVLPRMNGSFNREREFGKPFEKYHEQHNYPNAVDFVAPLKNNFRDFISFDNETECEESVFYDSTRTKNHGLQKMAPRRKRSYICNSQPKGVGTIDSEEEKVKDMLKKDSQESLSSKIESTKYRTSKDEAIKENPKILRSNTPSVISSHNRSTRTPNERNSNMYSAEKKSINNVRPQSAVEGKEMNFLIIKKREEITKMTQPIVDNQYHDRFVNKLFNNPPKEPCQSAKMLNRVVDSKSNGQIYATSERDDMNSHSGNSENDKTNRINPVVSRSGPEEKVTKNERTFTLRMTDTAMPRMDIEKEEKKFFSKLPIRTWKRLRTKEPAALRPESDATNADVKEKFQKAQNETTISNDHPERVENDDVREGARATANCSDVKRNEYFRRGLLRVDKPELTSSDLKNTKESKGSNAAKRTHEQWKKRTSAK